MQRPVLRKRNYHTTGEGGRGRGWKSEPLLQILQGCGKDSDVDLFTDSRLSWETRWLDIPSLSIKTTPMATHNTSSLEMFLTKILPLPSLVFLSWISVLHFARTINQYRKFLKMSSIYDHSFLEEDEVDANTELMADLSKEQKEQMAAFLRVSVLSTQIDGQVHTPNRSNRTRQR